MNTFATLQRNFSGFSLVVAPLLFAASTFFWESGEYTVTAATLADFLLLVPAAYVGIAFMNDKNSYAG